MGQTDPAARSYRARPRWPGTGRAQINWSCLPLQPQVSERPTSAPLTSATSARWPRRQHRRGEFRPPENPRRSHQRLPPGGCVTAGGALCACDRTLGSHVPLPQIPDSGSRRVPVADWLRPTPARQPALMTMDHRSITGPHGGSPRQGSWLCKDLRGARDRSRP